MMKWLLKIMGIWAALTLIGTLICLGIVTAPDGGVDPPAVDQRDPLVTNRVDSWTDSSPLTTYTWPVTETTSLGVTENGGSVVLWLKLTF